MTETRVPVDRSATARSKTIHQKLTELSRNLWWCWDPETTAIFRELDPKLWSEINHNPVVLLKHFDEQALEERASQRVMHSRINHCYRRFREYLESRQSWGGTHSGLLGNRPVAYFSAEFGMHESLPIYSGGLGILSGDHLKSSSDLDVPLVGVGLFYDEGYFTQSINAEGWQQEAYQELPREDLPLRPVLDDNEQPLKISVHTRSGDIHARIWELHVGRIRLFLLDTDIDENAEENRHLTSRLYGGDQRTRIRQEVMLGIGGAKALHALGIQPAVVHMNEGHSAFAPLEFIRVRMHEDGLSFNDAVKEVAPMGTFTTHTPVPAGHDRFGADLVDEHVGPLAESLGLSLEGLLALGRVDPQNPEESFCMTVLAFKLSRIANGVSNLHGVVSRRMWAHLWPWRSEEEVPIGHITNGVHVPTWLAPQMRGLYDRTLPSDWMARSAEPEVWAPFEDVSDSEFWETHQSLKNNLIVYTREHAAVQAKTRGDSDERVEALKSALDPRALTIGFARRFAPYKRADLIMQDLDLFRRLIQNSDHPVQFIFAGKAHPRDENGKSIVQRIYKMTEHPDFQGRVILLENYDINLGRRLVQGVDVWLNNPRRPLEASGTSGQKVVLNGGLNCSILDGWWAEGFDGRNGFAIGNGLTHADQETQDQRDAHALYDVVQNQVIPMYYDRDADDLPMEWISRMKRGVATLGWRFNADRMVMDYVTETYIPAAGGLSCHMNGMP